jgi:hypothetical protein
VTPSREVKMATNAAKLSSYLNLLDRTFDFDQGVIEEAPNGDRYIEVSVTTDNRLEERLERLVVNTLNRAVDPDAYGIDTGPTGGQNTSTYTLIYDKSSNDFDLIGGEYSTYRNDLAGISDNDVPFARSGFATGIFLDGHAYRIAVPWAEIFGTSIKDWTENWWIWGLQAPAETNPLIDPTGENAQVNNNEAVFFVAGTFGGPAERTFSVPEGTPLLIPVLNNIGLAFDTDPPGEADRLLAQWEPTVSNLFATIDGEPVDNVESYFVRTDYFTPGTPQTGSLLESVLDRFNLPPTEDLYPSRAAGYWLMVEGLTPGEHTISYGGTFVNEGTPVTVSVTDHITVTDQIIG